jgi:hypothetical protein
MALSGTARTQIAEEGAPVGFSLRVSPCSDALAFLGTLALDTQPPRLLLVSKVAERALPLPAGAAGDPQTAVQLLFAFSEQRALPSRQTRSLCLCYPGMRTLVKRPSGACSRAP